MFCSKTNRWPLMCVAAVCTGVLFLTASPANSQTKRTASAQTPVAASPETEVPVFTAYKGVKLGTSAADARAKLGIPRDKDDGGDFYVFSENESAQLVYDAGGTVKVISINYAGSNTAAPAVKDVLGEDAQAKPDGSLFKLIRYPKSGCWVSYNRTVGGNPMVVITMQKIPVEH